jgi:hypothetical protein
VLELLVNTVPGGETLNLLATILPWYILNGGQTISEKSKDAPQHFMGIKVCTEKKIERETEIK